MSEHSDNTDEMGRRGDVLTGSEAAALGVGAVVRWTHDRTDGGLRLHTPTQGWVPALASGGTYVVIWPAPALPPGYRAPTTPVRYAGSDGIGNAHCLRCHREGHVNAHPELGCADVGCDQTHGSAWSGESDGVIVAGGAG